MVSVAAASAAGCGDGGSERYGYVEDVAGGGGVCGRGVGVVEEDLQIVERLMGERVIGGGGGGGRG